MRVNSVMAPYRGRSFFFYNYFYSNNIDFLQSNSQTNHFSLTGCCSWRLSASCLLSREDTFMLIHLCYIAAFINRYSCKFCFQPVILVIKGEQERLAQWTDWRHVSVAFLEYTWQVSEWCLQGFKMPLCTLSQCVFPLWLDVLCLSVFCLLLSNQSVGIFLNRHSLSASCDNRTIRISELKAPLEVILSFTLFTTHVFSPPHL